MGYTKSPFGREKRPLLMKKPPENCGRPREKTEQRERERDEMGFEEKKRELFGWREKKRRRGEERAVRGWRVFGDGERREKRRRESVPGWRRSGMEKEEKRREERERREKRKERKRESRSG
ncbi:hypothetical protein I3843_08G125400 [Carya illinoinensis]|nr:hypothetical protein I3843_08G125400 [Carya illinoinensis]